MYQFDRVIIGRDHWLPNIRIVVKMETSVPLAGLSQSWSFPMVFPMDLNNFDVANLSKEIGKLRLSLLFHLVLAFGTVRRFTSATSKINRMKYWKSTEFWFVHKSISPKNESKAYIKLKKISSRIWPFIIFPALLVF